MRRDALFGPHTRVARVEKIADAEALADLLATAAGSKEVILYAIRKIERQPDDLAGLARTLKAYAHMNHWID
jgi:hypothetical protein